MPELDIFQRQYLLGPRAPATQDWPTRTIREGLVLAAHPDLPVSARQEEDRCLMILGDILDPDFPERDNQQVVDALFAEYWDYAALERALDRFGGRWVLYAGLGRESRLYPDATGSRPIYRAAPGGALWISSLPSVLAREFGFEPDHELAAELASCTYGDWWPGTLTPYQDVRHVGPNHYVDLNTAQSQRFWPREPLAANELDAAAREISRLLSGMIRAAANRGPLYLAVTGGYDSRVLIACAEGARDNINFFTLAYPGIEAFDLKTPPVLAKTIGFKYQSEPFDPPSDDFLSRFDELASNMVQGQCRLNAASYLRFPADAFFVEGTASEIIRCYYYKNGSHPDAVDGSELSRRAGFGHSPAATQAFDDWLARAPRDSNISTLDLFYWEQRVGNWSAADYQTQELVRKVFSPFNCRQLLVAGLGTPVQARKDPYPLHRAICRLMLPEVLRVRFNFSVRKTLEKFSRKVVRHVSKQLGRAEQRHQ